MPSPFSKICPLSEIPGLIIMIPAIIGLRGNISAAMGSRLGSAAHLGLISEGNIINKDSIATIYSSLILNVVMSCLAAFLAFLVCKLAGKTVFLIPLILIGAISGFLAGIVLAFLTIFLAFISFRKGYDMDNIICPGLATVGDVITVLILYLTVMVVGYV